MRQDAWNYLFIRKVNRSVNSIKVPTKPLLNIINEFGISHIDALKIDIEGAEDIVLKHFIDNAEPSLYPKIILIEKSYNLWNYNVIDFLVDKGYKPVRDFNKNLALEFVGLE
jgi:hypothetical protein